MKTKLHLEPPPRSRKMALCGDPKPDGLTGLPDLATCEKCLKLCKLSARKRKQLSEVAKNFVVIQVATGLLQSGKRGGAKRPRAKSGK